MSSKDCTLFTFGFLAGAAVTAASVPSFRRVAKRKVEEGLESSKQSFHNLAENLKSGAENLKAGVESKKRAVAASVEAAKSTYEDATRSQA